MTAPATQNLPTRAGGWRQVIAGFGVLLLLGGFLFAVNSAWKNYQLHVRRTAWPTVEARIAKCDVSGSAYYSSFRHSQGDSSFVRCRFEYQVDGSSRQSTINIGNTVFTPRGKGTFLPSGLTTDKMREWVARHPPAAVHAIHYNPGNPNEISFPEAEEELSSTPPVQQFWFGLVTALFGGLVIMLGKWKG
jgi:hypothetical protein